MTSVLQHMDQLIRNVNNTNQRSSLLKVYPGVADSDRLFMDSFVPAAAGADGAADSNVLGTFYIMGTMRGEQREKYMVKMHKTNPTFTCSCMDYKTNCNRLNRVCKHICFIVCRFGQMYDPAYFDTKTLTPDALVALHQRAQRLVDVGTPAIVENDAEMRECFQAYATPAPSYAAVASSSRMPRPVSFVTRKMNAPPPGFDPACFHNLSARTWNTSEEVSCPICFDEVGNSVETTVICPTCKNVAHRACIQVWLEKHTTCIMCRDDKWRWYQ